MKYDGDHIERFRDGPTVINTFLKKIKGNRYISKGVKKTQPQQKRNQKKSGVRSFSINNIHYLDDLKNELQNGGRAAISIKCTECEQYIFYNKENKEIKTSITTKKPKYSIFKTKIIKTMKSKTETRPYKECNICLPYYVEITKAMSS